MVHLVGVSGQFVVILGELLHQSTADVVIIGKSCLHYHVHKHCPDSDNKLLNGRPS